MKALVAYKKSTYEFYSKSSDPAVRAYVQGTSEHAQRIRNSHIAHVASLERTLATLDEIGWKYDAIWRADLESVNGSDIVIAVGGDGTFLDAAHYVRNIPILGVNSDPVTSVGYYCSTDATNLKDIIVNIDDTVKVPRTKYCRLELSIDGTALPEIALNDVLFAHPNPAGYSKYEVTIDGKTEKIGSSGLLIASAAGSTAWMYQNNGVVLAPDDDRMQYHHRDMRGRTRLVSQTREGKLYIDGEYTERDLGLGQELLVKCGSPIEIIGDLSKNRAKYVAPIAGYY